MAPSQEAEYVRFIEGDVFGKCLFKNYLMRVVGLSEDDIRMPIGKWGDIGVERHFEADAAVQVQGRWLSVEIKLARLNIANKTRGQKEGNWAFNGMLHSPSKATKKYDLLFAVGVNILGFENPNYWHHLNEVVRSLNAQGVAITADVLPHQAEYLHLCGAFVMPIAAIPTNHFRVTLRALDESRFREHFSWLGNDEDSRRVWSKALAKGA